MTTLEFQLHVDASLFNFQFKEAQYVTVKYGTFKTGERVSFYVSEIGMGPSLLCTLNNRNQLVRDATAAAKDHAEKYWKDKESNSLLPVFEEALRPFTKHIYGK